MAASHKSTRRDFLKGQAAVDALQDLAQNFGEAAGDESDASQFESIERGRAGYLLRIGRRAMACEFEVLLNSGQFANGMDAAIAALDVVDELEAQLTVYRDTSEVSALNRTAHLQPVELESRLFDLLAKAAEIHQQSGGAYDITAGPLSKVWGFYRRAGRVPTADEISETMQCVGMQHMQLDATSRSVRFGKRGVEINLGSIGKGYALDRAAEVLIAAGVNDFLMHGGNSSLLAKGSAAEGPDTPQAGWWVGLRHPLMTRRRIGEVCLHDRAIGTSGSGTQFFVHNGRRLWAHPRSANRLAG